jgi:hypothetical protein
VCLEVLTDMRITNECYFFLKEFSGWIFNSGKMVFGKKSIGCSEKFFVGRANYLCTATHTGSSSKD